jgi:hypothetical protein
VSRAIRQRLRKLEGSRSGPKFIASAFPLSDDPVRARAEIKALIESGEAVLGDFALHPARALTVEEWARSVAAATTLTRGTRRDSASWCHKRRLCSCGNPTVFASDGRISVLYLTVSIMGEQRQCRVRPSW